MKWLLILGALLCVPACQQFGLAVRFADVYLLHELDHFLDLTAAQNKEVKPEVKRVIKDIREQEFPKAADFLESIAASLQTKEPTKSQLAEWLAGAQKIGRSGIQRFEPLALQISKSSSKKQEENFAREFREKTEEMRAKSATPDQAFKTERKRVAKWIDYWLGGLSSAQEDSLNAFLHEHPWPIDLQLKNRDKLLADFLKTTGPAREDWIHQFYTEAEVFWLPEYKTAHGAWSETFQLYLLKLWGSLDPKQKKTMFEAAKKKAAELRKLSHMD